MPSRGILLDIEGTTTPIAFVYDVLFPFARSRVAELVKHADLDLRELNLDHDEDVRAGLNPPPWSKAPLDYIHWLMDQDRKSTALKTIQGKIWLEGYQNGELRGDHCAAKRWVCHRCGGGDLSGRALRRPQPGHMQRGRTQVRKDRSPRVQ